MFLHRMFAWSPERRDLLRLGIAGNLRDALTQLQPRTGALSPRRVILLRWGGAKGREQGFPCDNLHAISSRSVQEGTWLKTPLAASIFPPSWFWRINPGVREDPGSGWTVVLATGVSCWDWKAVSL